MKHTQKITKMKQAISIFLITTFQFSLNSFAQNVGVGNPTPTEKLHIDSGNVKLGRPVWTTTANDRVIKFGDGDFVRLGEIGADDRMELQAKDFIFKPSNAAFSGNVGIGTSVAPTAKLEVNGNFKLTNGSQAAGKVLTSDATGNSTWAFLPPTPFENTERFQFNVFRTNTNNGQLTTYYNFGTATTSYTTGTQFFNLNITKSGLYHFDINLSHNTNGDFSQASTNPRSIKFQLLDFGFGTIYTGYSVYNYHNGNAVSEASFDKSFDKYITAPAQLRFLSTTTNSGAFELNYLVTGHLISD